MEGTVNEKRGLELRPERVLLNRAVQKEWAKKSADGNGYVEIASVGLAMLKMSESGENGAALRMVGNRRMTLAEFAVLAATTNSEFGGDKPLTDEQIAVIKPVLDVEPNLEPALLGKIWKMAEDCGMRVHELIQSFGAKIVQKIAIQEGKSIDDLKRETLEEINGQDPPSVARLKKAFAESAKAAKDQSDQLATAADKRAAEFQEDLERLRAEKPTRAEKPKSEIDKDQGDQAANEKARIALALTQDVDLSTMSDIERKKLMGLPVQEYFSELLRIKAFGGKAVGDVGNKDLEAAGKQRLADLEVEQQQKRADFDRQQREAEEQLKVRKAKIESDAEEQRQRDQREIEDTKRRIQEESERRQREIQAKLASLRQQQAD